MYIICESKHIFKLFFGGLKPSTIDGRCKRCLASWKEMSVRVQNGGFMLICFYIRILCPMSYLELWSYIYMARSLLSRLTCITLTSAKPRVTTWLPFEPFWFRLRPVLGNTGYDLDQSAGVFNVTIKPFCFRLRPVLGRIGCDHGHVTFLWLRSWSRYRKCWFQPATPCGRVSTDMVPTLALRV